MGVKRENEEIMRYIYSRVVVAVVLLVASCTMAYAQESKRVEISTTYRPEVAQATKLMAPTTIEDVPVINPEIEYNVVPQTWQVSLETEDYEPIVMYNYDFKRAKPLYAKLGVGYSLASDAALRYAVQNKRVGYFGVGLDHRANFQRHTNSLGMLRSIADSYDMNNGATLGGGVYVGRALFEATATYNNDIYNRYAELLDDPSRVIFHDAVLSLRFGDEFVDLSHFNFSLEARGGYWSHLLPVPSSSGVESLDEFSGGALFRLARNVGKGVIGLNAGYDMWQSSAIEYMNTRWSLGLEYMWRWGIANFELGVAYKYDYIKNLSAEAYNPHRVLPRLKISLDVEKASLVPYLEVATNMSQNSVASLYRQNPYIDFDVIAERVGVMLNSTSYDMSVGLDGSLLARRFTYRAYAGVNLQRNQTFWYVNREGTFGVVTGDNDRLFWGVELGVRPINNLRLSAGYKGHSDSIDANTPYCTSDAKFMVDFSAEYSYKRWKFQLSTDVIGPRVWCWEANEGEIKAAGAIATPTSVDLGVGVSYAIKDWAEIYLNGYNLLNNSGLKTMYDYAFYDDSGIGFMCGVKLNF